MNTVTPCRGHGRIYDAAMSPRTPSPQRLQARAIASAYCSRCPIASSCTDRIAPPSPRFTRKVAAMSAEPTATPPEPRPAPQLVQTAADVPLTDETLLVWGANHTSTRYQALAARATSALTDLRKAYVQDAKVSAAEARIERLEAQLANAKADLAAAKGKPAKPATTTAAPVDYAAVRAWGREHGYEVGTVGRPKRALVDAYLAAQAA